MEKQLSERLSDEAKLLDCVPAHMREDTKPLRDLLREAAEAAYRLETLEH